MNDDVDYWSMISFEPKKKPAVAKPAAGPLKACPKCGKALGKGGHFHTKACKGPK